MNKKKARTATPLSPPDATIYYRRHNGLNTVTVDTSGTVKYDLQMVMKDFATVFHINLAPNAVGTPSAYRSEAVSSTPPTPQPSSTRPGTSGSAYSRVSSSSSASTDRSSNWVNTSSSASSGRSAAQTMPSPRRTRSMTRRLNGTEPRRD